MNSELNQLLEVADRLIAQGKPLPLDLQTRLLGLGVDISKLT